MDSSKTARLVSAKGFPVNYTFPDGFVVKVPGSGPSEEIPLERAKNAVESGMVRLYEEPAVEAPKAAPKVEAPKAAAAKASKAAKEETSED